MKNNFDLHKWKEYQLFLNEQEEFSLGDNDLELAKGFNVEELTVGDIITPNMLQEQEHTANFRKNNTIITIKEIRYGSEVRLSWKTREDKLIVVTYNISDVNEDFLKPEFQIETPLEESFELGDEDLELAKDFQDFNIEIIGYSTYTFHNYEDDDNDLVEKTTKCIINSEDLERELGIPIPHNPEEIESIIYDNIWDNDFLMEKILEGDEVIEDIPDYYFESPWENEWEDLQVDVKILDKVKESFELTADDLEMAKDFNPNIIYLGKGDTIEPGIINSRGSYYIVGFEGNNILLKKDNSEYISKFSINMVQNKMEDGYILDPYK
jgi:hypothetical protein